MYNGGIDYYLLFNEGAEELELRLQLAVQGRRTLLEPTTGQYLALPNDGHVLFPKYAMRVVAVEGLPAEYRKPQNNEKLRV